MRSIFPAAEVPDNQPYEARRFYVLRSDRSGGPYEQISEGWTTTRYYLDKTATPGKKYHYVVQSVEPSGAASLYSAEVQNRRFRGPGEWTGHVRHFYEAEYGTLSGRLVQQMEWRDTSGGWYVRNSALEPDPSYPISATSSVEVTVSIPKDGENLIWGRIKNFSLRLLDTAVFDLQIVDSTGMTVAQGEIGNLNIRPEWHWSMATLDGADRVDLARGNYTIAITPRKLDLSHTGIALDVLMVTHDPAFVPEGFGAWDSERPPAPENLQVSPLSTTAVGFKGHFVSWDPVADVDMRYYNVYAATFPPSAPQDNLRL